MRERRFTLWLSQLAARRVLIRRRIVLPFDWTVEAVAAMAGAARSSTNRCRPPQPRMQTAPPATRKQELRAFIALAVVLAPVLAVMIVGSYGLLVWLFQIILGPPGTPLR